MKRTFFVSVASIIFLAAFYAMSGAIPAQQGPAYEITAKLLSVEQGSKHSSFDAQRNMYVVVLKAKVEVIKITPLIDKGEVKTAKSRDKYRVGQRVEIVIMISEKKLNEDKSIIDAGSIINGRLYSHGDEGGDWYDFDVISI